jgi:hypothetical protein
MALQLLKNLGRLTYFSPFVPSIAFILQRLTPVFLKPSSTSSSHLFLGFPLLLPPPALALVPYELTFCLHDLVISAPMF